MRYRSRVIFRIRSYWLPCSHSIFKERYSGYLVLAFQPSPTGLSPCFALLSSRPQVSRLSQTQVQTSHPPFLSEGVRFVLFPFRSPLLRESRLFSFPADTEMFQFSASAIVTDHLRRDGKSQWSIPGSMAACAYPGLNAACHTLLRYPNQAIHHTAYLTLLAGATRL